MVIVRVEGGGSWYCEGVEGEVDTYYGRGRKGKLRFGTEGGYRRKETLLL